MDSSVRKQVYELTADDLRHCPAWEFALDEEGDDGHDEATVRPIPPEQLVDRLDGSIIVSATFELADGTCFPGYLTPREHANCNLGEIQPQIIAERGQVMFWYGRCTPQTEHAYEMLNRESHAVFPIRFKTLIPIEGSECVGEIPGFLCLDDFRNVTIVK